MIDANVDDAVGDFLLTRAYNVDYINKSFLPGTPDNEIDSVARIEGWVIVSHDQRFLQKIQQPRYGFSDLARTGYGRIMLMTRESQQLSRISQAIDLIEMCHGKAVESERRLLITLGPNWIRYDDEPLSRTARGSDSLSESAPWSRP